MQLGRKAKLFACCGHKTLESVQSSLCVLRLVPLHYLQRAAVSSVASGAVSGKGRWSHKARPSPGSATLSSGCSPPPPDRCCCQKPHCGNGVNGSGSNGQSQTRQREGERWVRKVKQEKGKVMRLGLTLEIKYS